MTRVSLTNLLNISGKRINFVSIQNSQTVFAEGYTPVPCRTGYERVISHRTDDLYAKTAEEDGVVEKLSERAITIRYASGAVVSYELGRRFGAWGGVTLPHNVVSDLKLGEKIKSGTAICYNSHYFTKDNNNKGGVIYKQGVMGRIAMLEEPATLEDGSRLTLDFCKKLGTYDTYVRAITVDFDLEVRNLVKVGDTLDPESILCTIHSTSEGNTDLYSDASLSTLAKLSTASPKADKNGIVERIEVVYTGEIDDMSSSLRALADRSDSERVKLHKALGKRVVDGRVDVGHRVDGKPLDVRMAAIIVYITRLVPMGDGDKVVYGAQMKSVTGNLITGEFHSDDGKPLDGSFSYASVDNRIVNSFPLVGTTSTLLIALGESVTDIYFNNI